MDGSVTINKAVFDYRIVGGNYVIITGYRPKSGAITFNKTEDGYRRHYIEVPETVESLPVMALSSFALPLETAGEKGYRHDGTSWISLSLPEYTVFNGFDAFYDETGYFTPNYDVSYYPRTQSELLFCKNSGTVFLAKPLSAGSCKIIFISTDDKCREQTLIIPPELCGYKTVLLDNECSYHVSAEIKTLVLSDGIKEIGVNCFCGDLSLQKVYLGKDTEKISFGCFRYKGDDKLTVYCRKNPVWIDVRQGIKLLPFEKKELVAEDGVLLKCEFNLSCIALPTGLRAIADYAFYGNHFVKSIALPEGVERVGAHSFEECASLEFLSLPKTLNSIGTGAFHNCKKLRYLSFPDKVSVIESSLCENCTELSDVSLPKNLHRIEENAFKGCSLQKVDIPEGASCIKYHAFADCPYLNKVSLPKSIKELDVYAFSESGIEDGVYVYERQT